MSFSRLTGTDSFNPRFRDLHVNNIIEPDMGANPVDSGFVQLLNIRGQLLVTGIADDSGVEWSLRVYSDFFGNPTDNYHLDTLSPVNATVELTSTNTFTITTDATDAGGRVYELVFNPTKSFGPRIRQTSGNVVGNNNLTIKMSKTKLYY